jgi:hypothetical protein
MSAEREPLLRDEDPDLNDQDDELVVPSSRNHGGLHNGKFTLLEKVLIALATTFFITLCVLAGLYARRVYEEKPGNSPPHTVPAPPGDENTAVSVV